MSRFVRLGRLPVHQIHSPLFEPILHFVLSEPRCLAWEEELLQVDGENLQGPEGSQ